MRLIGQYGYVDIPYELSALSVGNFADKIVIYVRSKLFDEKPFVIAEYSSETKALIVMESLRKAYFKNLNHNHKNYGDLVFRFPKDDEV